MVVVAGGRGVRWLAALCVYHFGLQRRRRRQQELEKKVRALYASPPAKKLDRASQVLGSLAHGFCVGSNKMMSSRSKLAVFLTSKSVAERS